MFFPIEAKKTKKCWLQKCSVKDFGVWQREDDEGEGASQNNKDWEGKKDSQVDTLWFSVVKNEVNEW